MKATREIIGAAMVFLLALVIWFLIPYQIAVITKDRINAQFVPRIISMVFILISAVNLVIELIKGWQWKNTENGAAKQIFHPMRSTILFCGFILYGTALKFLNFELATIVLGCSMLAIVGIKKWQYYAISSLITIVIGYVFRTFFYVYLP